MTEKWLDVGCGIRKAGGWIGIDNRPYPGVDHVMNIGTTPIPYPDDYFDKIKSIHVFEHLYPEELFFCMDECFRVCKPTGFLEIQVPKAGTPAYYIHPDHKIQFVENTFGFFQVPSDVDHHGYIKGFWHVSVQPNEDPNSITVYLYPNKPGGRHDYKEVKMNYQAPV